MQIFDKKGDVFSYPKVVNSLPFKDAGNTYLTDDNYTLSCSSGLGQGRVSMAALPRPASMPTYCAVHVQL